MTVMHVTIWRPASYRLVKALMAGRQQQTGYRYTFFMFFWLYHRIIHNFHVGDFDPLPDSQVIGEKVSCHG